MNWLPTLVLKPRRPTLFNLTKHWLTISWPFVLQPLDLFKIYLSMQNKMAALRPVVWKVLLAARALKMVPRLCLAVRAPKSSGVLFAIHRLHLLDVAESLICPLCPVIAPHPLSPSPRMASQQLSCQVNLTILPAAGVLSTCLSAARVMRAKRPVIAVPASRPDVTVSDHFLFLNLLYNSQW